jgi:hypothetical protein
MRRSHSEPVGVSLRQGRPARFVWRGRLYTVLLVLDRQVIPSSPAAAAETDPPGPDQASGQSQSSGQEVWLVEATPQPAVAASRYELRQDLASGQWTLSRA